MKRTTILRAAAILVVFLLGTISVKAQTTTATITGAVLDPSGAAIPAVNVAVENLQTHNRLEVTTNSSGFYRVAGLIPGVYRETVSKNGFKSAVRDGIELHGQDEIALNYSMQVGSVSESITVESSEPLLQSDSSTVSTVIEQQQIENAPLNGRNVMGLAALTPGVVPQGATSGNALNNQSAIGNYTNPAGWNNFQIGGGVAGDNLVYVDGGPLNLPTNNWMGYIPGQDSVQEFRVETNNISSEWGGYYGGVLLFSTKSGTNELHGSAYEYFRNTVLDANNFFNPRTNTKRPPVAQNQYGVSLGGPVKKNKIFLFGNWEGFANRTGVPYTTVVPSVPETIGDFTADPAITFATATTIAGHTYAKGDQISCNGVLNTVCPDPTALYMASVYKYWAQPNVPNVAHGGTNFITNAGSGGNSNQVVVRGDYNLSSRQQLFARYTLWKTNTLGTNYYHNNMPQPQVLSTTDQAVVGDTITLNSTTVLDVRASYLRFLFTSQPPFMGHIDLTKFGPAFAAIAGQVTWDSVPIPLLSGYGNQYPLSIINVIQYYNYDKYDLTGNLTKTIGRHALKFGGDFQPNQAYLAGGSGGPDGNFTFQQNQPTTDTFANFMLGLDVQTSSSITTSRNTSSYNLTQGYYVNDTYQASRRLTVTGGLRWDLPGAILEKHDVNTVFLPTAANPIGTIANPANGGASQQLLGTLALVNSPAYPSRWDDKLHYSLFSPNLGFSYRLFPRTVVRGGFGMSHISYDYFGTVPTPFGSPITQYTTTATGPLSNPFPQINGVLQQPLGRTADLSGKLYEGINISGIVAGAKYPYAEQYNLNIQQELSANSVVQIGYQGSKGTHLHVSRNLNQLSDKYISQAETQYLSLVAGGDATAQADTFINQTQTAANNPLAGKLSPASAYNGVITNGQLLKPYPQFATSVSNVSQNDGDSIYNSLQGSYRIRLHSAGSFMAAYTWAKLIGTVDSSTTFLEASGAGSAQDNTNYLKSARSLESFDVPQRLVLNYSLVLPVGKGQHWMTNAGNGLNRVIGGWRASGITAFTHGYPLAITALPEDISNKFGTGAIRPNRVAGCDPKITGSAVSRLNKWYNTACFVQPPTPFSFGNEGRTDPRLYAQGIDNWDISLAKETNVTEHVHLNFDAEFLNAFNRVQFGPPNNQVGNANYGKVTAQVNQPRLIQFAARISF